ncbi:MAG TPA: hypothetical protein VN752_05285 [Solirubrobacterales bacterium]|nr:hypothetical protein [Solirubrobacterales bacterium]
MKDNDPSGIDRNKGVSDLPMLDEILEIAPGLEAGWAAERAALPPGTLVNDGGEAAEGGEGGGSEGEPEGEPEGGGEEESFIDSFDLDGVEPAARPAVEALQKDWQGKYTQKRQADRAEVEEARREAEQSQALVEGLRDPNTMPHYLRLLGVDLSNPQTLELLGISGGGQGNPDEELLDLLDDEDDVESRVERIEREREEEVQERQSADMEQALDDLADQELERIEQAWGRELDPDEDVFLRHRAEANPGPDGLPDYEAAAETLKAFLGRREQEWAKRRSEPGRGNTGGKPGGKALDMESEDDRIAAGAAAAERAMASDD